MKKQCHICIFIFFLSYFRIMLLLKITHTGRNFSDINSGSKKLLELFPGLPSNIRGGRHALEVIQQFEFSISSEKTLARKFGNIQRVNNISKLLNIMPLKRKLIINQNIHSLTSSFEDTAANHGVGGEKVRPSEGGILLLRMEIN